MTQKNILVVANKILGIYLLIQALKAILQTSTIWLNPRKEIAQLLGSAIVLQTLILLAVAFCLIKWAEPIANMIASAPNELNNAQSQPHKDDLLEVAFCIIGVFLIASALPRFSQVSLYLLQATRIPQNTAISSVKITNPSAGVTLAEIITQIIVGLILIIGSHRIVELIKQIRGR